MVTFMWVVLFVATLYLYNKHCVSSTQSAKDKFFQGLPFDFVCKPAWVKSSDIESLSDLNASLLLCYRLPFAIYFWVLFILLFTEGHTKAWFYFTDWNVVLVASYFSFATCCSAIGLGTKRRNSPEQLLGDVEVADAGSSDVSASASPSPSALASPSSGYKNTLGNCTQILFEVAVTTAFFITVINFMFLDARVSFFNFSQHLVTSVTLAAEMCINSLIIRLEHIVFLLVWVYLYVVFVWVVVGSRLVENFPYFFLNVDSPACFAWYPVLFLFVCIFFVIVDRLSRLKSYMLPGATLGIRSVVADETIVDDSR